jgi:hypothetical protein
MTVVGIDSESVTGPRQVRQYGTINPNDVTVYAFFKDDSRKPVSNKSIVGFDSSRVGPQTVTVRITGNFTATFQTEVMALNGITVTAQPNPSTLKLGASAGSWPGLQIQGAWNGMGNANINASECQITGYDPNRAGRQTVTVSYQGKTATFNVNVVDLQSIRIASAPTKVTYNYGENLDLSGMRVTGTWPGLPEEAVSITSSNVTGYNPQTIGRQTLTVTYRGKTATFSVEVVQTLNGTWFSREWNDGEQTYTFNNGNWTYSLRYPNSQGNGLNNIPNNSYLYGGTYTTSGGKITMTTTHVHSAIFAETYGIPSRLYTRDELEAAIRASERGKTMSESNFEMVIRYLVMIDAKGSPQDYSLEGNTLVIQSAAGLGTGTFTRR